MKETEILILDVETTGLLPRFHEVWEIGCILTDLDLKPIEFFEGTLPVRYPSRAAPEVFELGFKNYGDRGPCSWPFVLDWMRDRARGALLGGHNAARFDIPMILGSLDVHEIADESIPLSHHFVDTVSNEKMLQLAGISPPGSLSLGALCNRYGIPIQLPQHRALPDAWSALHVLQAQRELLRGLSVRAGA